MSTNSLAAARFRVPCSTSNLGAGFDCVGLAFDRYLEAEFQPGPGELTIERTGTLAGLDIPADRDLVVQSLRAGLSARGRALAGGVLRVSSAIPVGRGLGSSAAATVAGFLLAAAAAGETPERSEILQRASELEGHPDNAAPALYGGLVGIAKNGAGRPQAFRLPLSERIAFVYAAPPVEISTAHARRVLPETVPHATAVAALARLAALLQGLATGDAELLRIGFRDELHVPYRMPLIPRGAEVVEAAEQAGAIGVTISGSGSGLIAVCEPAGADRVLDAMRAALEPGACVAFRLQPSAAAEVL